MPIPHVVTVSVSHHAVVRTQAQQKEFLEEAVGPLVGDVAIVRVPLSSGIPADEGERGFYRQTNSLDTIRWTGCPWQKARPR